MVNPHIVKNKYLKEMLYIIMKIVVIGVLGLRISILIHF